MKRGVIVLIVTLAAAVAVFLWANWPATPLSPTARADLIVVDKAARELLLQQDGRVLKRYRVSLGGNPKGPKRQERDERTPEGSYRIDYRKGDSAFHLALHVSYPNESDRRRADEAGVDPGGLIMVHGLPNLLPFLGRLHRLVDWTNGCIAVTNPEIEEIWSAVQDGTPIEIRP